MIRAIKEKCTEQSPDITFTIIAKAHRRARRQHLTLDLCEAVQEKTGKPFVPSTPAGLVLLLDAMQPKIARHVTRVDAIDVGGERIKELLRRYEEGGQVSAAVRCLRILLSKTPWGLAYHSVFGCVIAWDARFWGMFSLLFRKGVLVLILVLALGG